MYIYIILINILTFITFGIDKKKAILREQRISENTLLVICLIGGVFGGIVGMLFFHHKTKKIKFLLSMPVILLIWSCFLLNF